MDLFKLYVFTKKIKYMVTNSAIRSLALTWTLMIGITPILAQEGKLKRANKQYDDFAYIDAAEIYLDVAESGYKSEELFKKLGNTYYFNAQYNEALKWYTELLTLNPQPDESIYLLRYAQTLKALGKDKESEKVYNDFLETFKSENPRYSDAQNYLDIIEKNSYRYTLEPLSINSEEAEFGTAVLGDKLIFSSSKEEVGVVKRLNAWTNAAFSNIYEVTIGEDGNLGEPLKIAGNLNSKYNESSPAFTRDGNTVYFTRNNNTPLDKSDKKQRENLKIYRATKTDDKWGNIQDLSINGDNYSTAHPALSPDENTLYFVSNRPGSRGETDIFSVTIKPDGTFGKPRNLGPEINTKGRESFPFVSSDYELYFVSDGHFGLGGYDVFYVDLKSKVLQMVNLGKPINGPEDDFAFSIDNATRKGYFSSNRTGGKGLDDIYAFTETRKINEAITSTISGTVTDKDTNEPLKDVRISLKDNENQVVTVTKTDENGRYTLDLNKYYDHTLVLTREDYDATDLFVGKGSESQTLDFQLKSNVIDVIEGTDVATILNMAIYFDLNGYSIRPDAEPELAKIAAIMKRNPELKITVRSHTDSRANDNYNLNLSQKRAEATVQFIISLGIDPERISGEGFGEQELLNHCSNGVSCSKEEHQLNRRSEFIIDSIKNE